MSTTHPATSPSGVTYLTPAVAHACPQCHPPAIPRVTQLLPVPLSGLIRHPQASRSDFCPPWPTLLPSSPPAPPAGWHRAATPPSSGTPGADWPWSLCPCTPCRQRVPWEEDKPPLFSTGYRGKDFVHLLAQGPILSSSASGARSAGEGPGWSPPSAHPHYPHHLHHPHPALPAQLHTRGSCTRPGDTELPIRSSAPRQIPPVPPELNYWE